MRLFDRLKRNKKFEKLFEELDSAVLKEKDLEDTEKVEQYVIERLEQVIDLTREIEDEKAEYRAVTAYLNDIQKLENLSEEERKKIEETAANVVQLNSARNGFLNSARRLTDAQFAQMEQEEKDMPAVIRRLASNELYQETIKKDMQYLEREKSRWLLHREYLSHQQKGLKNLLYILIGIAAVVAVVLLFLQFGFGLDVYYAWMTLIFVTAIAICADYLKMLRNDTEILMAEKSANKAITLLNKVKIKYVNVTNAVDYACEKYHVRKAEDLNRLWEYYMDAVKEREKYQRTNEDLEYFNGRLIRALEQYRLYDARVWVTQAAALIDNKEMVEIQHNLVNRRQKLRDRIEYNVAAMKELKQEAERMVDKVGGMKPQIEEILQSMNRLSEVLYD